MLLIDDWSYTYHHLTDGNIGFDLSSLLEENDKESDQRTNQKSNYPTVFSCDDANWQNIELFRNYYGAIEAPCDWTDFEKQTLKSLFEHFEQFIDHGINETVSQLKEDREQKKALEYPSPFLIFASSEKNRWVTYENLFFAFSCVQEIAKHRGIKIASELLYYGDENEM